ncbi:hypothetical protein G6F35_016295 [Rhizopus arrhizus]|nr:hypothetical protein G6F35_016295 [Rhizopus arrhizus]
MSVTSILPVATSVPSSVTAPSALPVRTGSSLEPLMVIETSCVVTPPWPSLTVTVNFSVSDSPTPSACTAGLPLARL